MINFANQPKWHLDDNGVNIIGPDFTADLHNEYKVTGLEKHRSSIILLLARDKDYVKPDVKLIADKLRLSITNVKEFEEPHLAFPAVFEGIYDFKGNSLNLCIGNERCYLVKGDLLQLSFEVAKEE